MRPDRVHRINCTRAAGGQRDYLLHRTERRSNTLACHAAVLLFKNKAERKSGKHILVTWRSFRTSGEKRMNADESYDSGTRTYLVCSLNPNDPKP